MGEISQNCKKHISPKICVLLVNSMKFKKLNIDHFIRQVLLKTNNLYMINLNIYNYSN